jgi:putative ABC transport system permease protein
MTLIKLLLQTLRHYFGSSLATASGIAISTAVICGALIIGDSLRESLLKIVDYRLGQTTHSITAGERIFTKDLGERLDKNTVLEAASVLKTEAIVSVQGGSLRVNKVHLWGIDSSFIRLVGKIESDMFPAEDEVLISQNLAARLMVEAGDFILLRLKVTGPIPSNTPFVSEDNQTVARRIKIKAIVDKEQFGHFNLQTSQSAPFNIFVNIDWLNRAMETEDMANLVLVKAGEKINPDEIEQFVRQTWQLEDANLKLEFKQETGHYLLTSQRVFIDDYLYKEIGAIFPEAENFLTYFVNSLIHKDKETPYSFVSAMESSKLNLKPDETFINEWLANDLQIGEGDSLLLKYFEVGPLRTLIEKENYFKVKGIISMKDAANDHLLMPHLPGLSDAGNCRDWETGIPIKLESIRQKDEDYWEIYKGTPKAYISLHSGQVLWQNRFGKLTGIQISASEYNEQEIRDLIKERINPFKLEFQVNEVRKQGLLAAKGGVDFSQLFAGLGVFIIISGLMLTVLLLNLSLKRRSSQIRLYTSLGFSNSLIKRIILSEAFIITLFGAIAGVVFSIGYSKLILAGLNQNWHDIVRTEVLSLHFNILTLTAGMVTSIILGMIVVYFGVNKTLLQTNKKAESAKTKSIKSSKSNFLLIASLILIFASLLLILFLTVFSSGDLLFGWFTAGIMLLSTFLLMTYRFLFTGENKSSGIFSLKKLSRKNLSENPSRSFTIVVLLSLGSFVIIVTAANRKDSVDVSSMHSGGGGFAFMAETTVPFLQNLSNTDTRLDFGIPDGVDFIQFPSSYDDDASCLNLNRVANPRILAVDPELMEGRFSFVSNHPLVDEIAPWQSLNQNLNDVVPAVADQTVIQWGLGKKVGDTLTYVNESGSEVKLLLIGGLANSIFQGNVIISEENFAKHFPSKGGSNVFLIETSDAAQANLNKELSSIFRDFGWEMMTTDEKLAEFNAVENTYLRIFFLMGAFGMLLGTIGLAIIIAKSLLERKSEMALLSALGFKNKTILKLYFNEYFALFLTGIFAGALTAVVATLPTFLSGNQTVSFGFLISIFVILVLNGLFWIFLITTIMLRKLKLLQALRNE